MARMLSEDRIVDVELGANSDVVGFLLDNGQHVKVRMGTYREYTPTTHDKTNNGPAIYMCRPYDDVDTMMVGFVRNIIATYYHSPWTPE